MASMMRGRGAFTNAPPPPHAHIWEHIYIRPRGAGRLLLGTADKLPVFLTISIAERIDWDAAPQESP